MRRRRSQSIAIPHRQVQQLLPKSLVKDLIYEKDHEDNLCSYRLLKAYRTFNYLKNVSC